MKTIPVIAMKSRMSALMEQALALPEQSQKKIGCLVGKLPSFWPSFT